MYTGIIDVSHWEPPPTVAKLVQAREAGLSAVIAKCTQGRDYVDPTWARWARATVDAGLLLGAYHFASATRPGDAQADWFLRAVERAGIDLARILLCLDWEDNPNPRDGTMDTRDARTFLHRVHAITGRRPMLYTGSSFSRERIRDAADVIGEFPLWVAAYGPTQPKIAPAWRAPTLFQYTNGTQGPRDQTVWPRRTPHVGLVDRSAFARSAEQLRAEWPAVRV